MEYVEVLRAFRALRWFAGVDVLFIAVCAYVRLSGQLHLGTLVNGDMGVRHVVALCAGMAWVAATSMSTGLLNEAATVPFIWTRPMRRTSIAWRYVAVDAATIVVVDLLAFGTIYACAAVIGIAGYLTTDAVAIVTLLLGITTALMWYALVVLAGSRLPGRSGLVAGLSWAVFLIIGSLVAAPLPGPIHAALAGLDYLNPLVWYGNSSNEHVGVQIEATRTVVARAVTIPLGPGGRALGALIIAALALPTGIRLWATRET